MNPTKFFRRIRILHRFCPEYNSQARKINLKKKWELKKRCYRYSFLRRIRIRGRFFIKPKEKHEKLESLAAVEPGITLDWQKTTKFFFKKNQKVVRIIRKYPNQCPLILKYCQDILNLRISFPNFFLEIA